jgi:hypothetical protein
VIGNSFNSLMARAGDPDALKQVEAAFKASSNPDPEIRFRRKDSSLFLGHHFHPPGSG